MKVTSKRHFSISKKYARIRDLILAFVWHVNDAEPPVTYAITYPDAVRIGRRMKYTDTASWKQRGNYSTQTPSKRLVALLEPHRMDKKKWGMMVRR